METMEMAMGWQRALPEGWLVQGVSSSPAFFLVFSLFHGTALVSLVFLERALVAFERPSILNPWHASDYS
jgi:hypothetical protein